MSQVLSIPNLAGSLSYFAGNEYTVFTSSVGCQIPSGDFNLGTASGTGDSAVLTLGTSHGGAGGVSVSFADAEVSASLPSVVNMNAGDSLYLFVNSSSGFAADLYGSINIIPAVPSAGIGPSYCSVDRVKWLIGLPDSYSEQDARISELIASVSQSFDSFLGLTFSTVAHTEEHPGGFSTRIALDYLPTPGLPMTVTEGGSVVDPSGYSVSGSVVTRTGQVWPPGIVEFVYTSGSESVPADLQKAAAEESARGFRMANTGNGADNRLGVTSSTPETGGSSSFTADQWSPTTQRVLASYNRRFI